jgi:hypothetical protein
MHRAGTYAWLALEHDIQVEAEEAHHACTPDEVLELQSELAMIEAARWIGLQEQCLACAFDAQALWLRTLEACVLEFVEPWLAWNPRSGGGSAVPLLDPPTEGTPAAWTLWSETACAEFNKVWLSALQHDLEAESAAAIAG